MMLMLHAALSLYTLPLRSTTSNPNTLLPTNGNYTFITKLLRFRANNSTTKRTLKRSDSYLHGFDHIPFAYAPLHVKDESCLRKQK